MKSITTIIVGLLFFYHAASAQQWVARHGLSAEAYQTEFNKWTQQGFRPVSISVYSNRFAAIFEKQNNAPQWVARHGMTSAAYQTEFTKWTQQGFRPTRVSGYIVNNQIYYAAIFEKRINGNAWAARHGISAADYQTEFTKWTGQGFKLTDISTYTLNGQDYYAAIFEKINNAAPWQARHNMSAAQYQTEFNKWTGQGYRLTMVSANGSGKYAALWEKSGSGYMQARHNMNATQYQDEFDRLYYQGYRPVWINGTTINGQDNYAAIWEAKDGFKSADMQKVDAFINTFMTNYNVPGLSFALSKNGRLVLAKTYGYANKETGEMVAPRHRFRIASVSKPITATAIMKLRERNRIQMNHRIFGIRSILGFTYGNTPHSQNVDSITVEQLLTHSSGGWAGDLGFDPMFNYTNLNNADLISTTLNERPLDKKPGTEYHYSNFGFSILGRVIEKLSGQAYDSYVKDSILSACGISNMEIGGDTEADRKANEVKYYGQDGEDPYSMKVARMDAHGGWISNAIDLVRFLVRVDKFNTKPDILQTASLDLMYTASATNNNYAKGWAVNSVPNYWHNGSLPGEQAIIVTTKEGYCWSILVNTRSGNIGSDMDALMWNVKNSITYWPNWDLF